MYKYFLEQKVCFTLTLYKFLKRKPTFKNLEKNHCLIFKIENSIEKEIKTNQNNVSLGPYIKWKLLL